MTVCPAEVSYCSLLALTRWLAQAPFAQVLVVAPLCPVTRPLRLEYPGALWHVTNRGVERRNIYIEDRDRVHFLHLLQTTIADYRWQLVAYVLMSNHYHLLFFTPDTNLSRGMKDLDGDYASSFNARHERVGHLFQGRFKSHLVESETYLLEVARYIVLNPVRAGMVDAPGKWAWSSYRATAGLASLPHWLDPAPILDRLGPDNWNEAMTQYREAVAAAMGQNASPWEQLVAQAFLGGNQFLRMVEHRLRERTCSVEHLRNQRSFRATTIESIKKEIEAMCVASFSSSSSCFDARALLALLADRHTTATRAEIGRHLGITGQGAGYLIRSIDARVKSDPRLASLLLAVENRLNAVALEPSTSQV